MDRTEVLTGGNVSAGVVRIGDTVRKPAGPWTPAVDALLHHLESVGYDGAPRSLGTDDEGRHVLTFAKGVACWPDHFATAMHSDPAVTHVARMIRDFHDAVASFVPPPDAQWQTIIPPDRDEIIAHNDLAPWNLVMGPHWTFIDWDGAGPGSRLWDLAYAAHGFVPLSANKDIRLGDDTHRLRVLVDSYGLDEAGRHELVDLLAARAMSMHDHLEAASGRAEEPWARLWDEGHGAVWRADAEYIQRHAECWGRALFE